VETAGGDVLDIAGIGILAGIPGALYLPGVGEQTLVSVADLAKLGFVVQFSGDGFKILESEGTGSISGNSIGGRYLVDLEELEKFAGVRKIYPNEVCMKIQLNGYMNIVEKKDFLHKRLAHMRYDVIIHAMEKRLVDGIDDLNISELKVHVMPCIACKEGESKTIPFGGIASPIVRDEAMEKIPRATGDLVSMDFMFLDEPSIINAKNILCLYDAGSQMGWMYECRQKSEALSALKFWMNHDVLVHGRRVGNMRSDNATEFISDLMYSKFFSYYLWN
jgi:hypothetical protein